RRDRLGARRAAREAGARVSEAPAPGATTAASAASAGDGTDADPLAGIDLEAAAATPGTWLELAIAADHEAVEAVSEILSRAAPGFLSRGAPGGPGVGPGFELVDEGLAARVAPARPALVRAHLPVRDPASVRDAVARVDRELGHLQAFGLRPIGDLRTRVVHE